ncbi:MAG: serine hydrolase [Deltaproteobacteria bacterium]|nr:serine hydrolase [Deltaproteobacteria bacterium]
MQDHPRIRNLLKKGVDDGVYPGAVLLVALSGEIVFFEAVGHASLVPTPSPMGKETVFDLASLTKPLATTLAIMKLLEDGKIDLDQPLSNILPVSLLSDKKDLNIRLILSHSAGFVDWRPFYLNLTKVNPEKRKHIIREQIIEEPFVYKTGTGCLYSDLGFMILEWIVEEISGTALKTFVDNLFFKPLHLANLFLSTNGRMADIKAMSIASTEDCPWRKRVLCGEVHDENAFALGGYSGHAGLFGDAEGVFHLVDVLRGHYLGARNDCLSQKTVKTFFTKQDLVPGCTWALGWDTPSQSDSSAGRYFSPNSVGHLGFTGTSVWMDLEKDVIVIILTNRVHPTRNNQKIRGFRPILHDAVMEEFQRSSNRGLQYG